MDNKEARKEAKRILKEKQKETRKKAKKTFEDWKAFAMKGNIVDMAIGVVIGGAFTTIVNTLVSSIITPLLGLLTKDVDLSKLFLTVKGGHFATIEEARAAGAVILTYGELLNAIINFLIISVVLFLVIRFVQKATAKKEEVEEETTKTCPYCMSKIHKDATKCAHCASDLTNE